MQRLVDSWVLNSVQMQRLVKFCSVERGQMQISDSGRSQRIQVMILIFLGLVLCSERALALVGGNEITDGDNGITLAVAPEKMPIASTAIGGSMANLSSSCIRPWRIHDAGLIHDFRDDWPKFEFNWVLLLGTIIGMSGSILGSLAGVGGGGFYLPMFDFIIGFDAKTSTALSKSMVMGNVISTYFFTIREKHPTENRPVIDYDISMLFQPMILLGISIGVILNVSFPEWLVTVLLVILVTNLSRICFKRAIAMWKIENMNQKDRSLPSAINSEISNDVPSNDYVEISAESSEPEQETVSWEWFPKANMSFLILTWLSFLALQVIKEVYVEGCSLWYWLLTLMQVPVALGVAIWEAVYQHKRGQPTDHDNNEGGLTVNETSAPDRTWWTKLSYSLFGLLGGILGGLLGVGGGGIMGPAFLELGLSAQVSSATASFIMIFSSTLSVVEFYLLDRLPGDFAIYFILVACFASALSQAGIKQIIYKSGKISIIVFMLAFCLAGSGVVLGTFGLTSSYSQWKSGEYMGIKGLCAE